MKSNFSTSRIRRSTEGNQPYRQYPAGHPRTNPMPSANSESTGPVRSTTWSRPSSMRSSACRSSPSRAQASTLVSNAWSSAQSVVSARSAPPVLAGSGTPGSKARTRLRRGVELGASNPSLRAERYACSTVNTPQGRSSARQGVMTADRSIQAVPASVSRSTTQKRTGTGGATSGAVHSTQVAVSWPPSPISRSGGSGFVPAGPRALDRSVRVVKPSNRCAPARAENPTSSDTPWSSRCSIPEPASNAPPSRRACEANAAIRGLARSRSADSGPASGSSMPAVPGQVLHHLERVALRARDLFRLLPADGRSRDLGALALAFDGGFEGAGEQRLQPVLDLELLPRRHRLADGEALVAGSGDDDLDRLPLRDPAQLEPALLVAEGALPGGDDLDPRELSPRAAFADVSGQVRWQLLGPRRLQRRRGDEVERVLY